MAPRKTAENAGSRKRAADVRAGRAELGGQHDAGERRHHAGQKEGAGGDAADADAGQPRGLRVAADAVQVAADRRVLEQPPQHDGQRHHVEHRQRQAPDLVLPDARERGRDPVGDLAASGDPLRAGQQDAAHAEGADERVDVQPDHDERVHQPDHQPDQQGDDDAEDPAVVVGLEPDDHADRHAERARDGQVERAAGHRHDQAHGHHGRDGLRPGDDPRVVGRQEQVRHPQREDQDQHRPHVQAAEPVEAQDRGEPPPRRRRADRRRSRSTPGSVVCLSTVIVVPFSRSASLADADQAALRPGRGRWWPR